MKLPLWHKQAFNGKQNALLLQTKRKGSQYGLGGVYGKMG